MTDQGTASTGTTNKSIITDIRELTQCRGCLDEAKRKMVALLNRKFDFNVLPESLKFDIDNALALNSMRAEFRTEDDQHLFLKCHHEENEVERVGEYYRSGILEQAGFPIEPALYQSSTVGEQMVIYAYRDRNKTPELHSVARQIEAAGCLKEDVSPVANAFDKFQQLIGERYTSSLHLAEPSQIAAEAVHGLYHRRLVDHEDDQHFGARIHDFYMGKLVPLPGGQSIPFEQFWHLRWRINDRQYDHTLHSALTSARKLLKPTAKEPIAAVTAHGDDHTGNLLYNASADPDKAIMYFDPAFAGHHVPALQAPCKALYHICFAHPNMLYNPEELDTDIRMDIDGDVLVVSHNWQLSLLRQCFLKSQIEHVWTPLLSHMHKKDILPHQWEHTIAATLLCCPLLCKNLISELGSPNPLTKEASLLTFSVAMQLANGDLGGTSMFIKNMLSK